ncbi:hypothetical protein H0H93_013369, partial [Arthromyces matolae]
MRTLPSQDNASVSNEGCILPSASCSSTSEPLIGVTDPVDSQETTGLSATDYGPDVLGESSNMQRKIILPRLSIYQQKPLDHLEEKPTNCSDQVLHGVPFTPATATISTSLDDLVLKLIADPPPSLQRKMLTFTQKDGDLQLGSYDLTDTTVPAIPNDSGSFADVFKGKVNDKCEASFKVPIRSQNTDLNKLSMAVTHELGIWLDLPVHHAIHPLYGMCLKDGKSLAFVSPWMEHGDLHNYLEIHTEHNRVLLALNTAQGLRALHKRDIIHGDLKS